MQYNSRSNLICMVAFNYFMFFLLSVLSLAIPAWPMILSTLFFLVAHVYLTYQERIESRETSSMLVSCLPLIGVTCFFIYLCWCQSTSPLYAVQLLAFFRSTLLPVIAGLLLIEYEEKHKDPNSTNTDRMIAIIPVLLFTVLFPVIVQFNCFGLLSPLLLEEVQNYTVFFMLIPLGMYTAKNSKFMLGTFNPKKFPKYILGAIVAITTIFILRWQSILPFHIAFSLVPLSQYICYVLFLIPVVFHQTLTEEFLFRSVPLWLAKQQDTPWALIPFIIGGATFLFAFHHIFRLQMGVSLLSLQLAMAIWLPPALSLMFISLYSQDSVEYSSGMHFGWNLAISILLPIIVSSGGAHAPISIGLLFAINLGIEAIKIITIIGIEKICSGIANYTIPPANDAAKISPPEKVDVYTLSLWERCFGTTALCTTAWIGSSIAAD